MEDEHSIHWAEKIHKPLSWCCDVDHNEMYFSDEAILIKHIETEHPDHRTESEILRLKEWCEIRQRRLPYTCPICNCVPREIALVAPWLVQNTSMESTKLEPPTEIRESLDSDFRQILSHHVASHLKPLGFMSLAYIEDGKASEDMSLASNNALTGSNGDRLLDEWADIPAPDFDNYTNPSIPEPLDEQIFELEWTRVKDFSLSLGRDFEMNLQKQSPFLAYLSTSGAGRVDNDKLVNESIHLISAFQLAGFRHVIGTLWEVDDEYCVDIARITYEGIRDGGMTDESVCRGLHKAIREHRDRDYSSSETDSSRWSVRGMDTDGRYGWVPFVHFGV